jgi:hypothetical protein
MAYKRIFLTTVGAGTWTVPDDWNDSDNSIECIGGGGKTYGNNFDAVGGGGGGAYSKKNNLILTPGASISYYVGASDEDSWFKSITDVLAKHGNYSSGSPGVGGQASSGYGDVKYSGGNGGSGGGSNGGGGGGGGAAGPNGNGNNGLNNSAAYGGDGGQGDLTFGGLGGLGGNNVHPNTVGSNGEEWTTHGSGGGGGGGSVWNVIAGKTGGLYGGGAGGKAYNTSNDTPGAQGIIVITYTPASSTFTPQMILT